MTLISQVGECAELQLPHNLAGTALLGTILTFAYRWDWDPNSLWLIRDLPNVRRTNVISLICLKMQKYL